jgi:hypothetical protein
MDGNFQHRHQKAAGRNEVPLVTPSIFVNPSKLEALKEYIQVQEYIHKISKKVSPLLFVLMQLIPDSN